MLLFWFLAMIKFGNILHHRFSMVKGDNFHIVEYLRNPINYVFAIVFIFLSVNLSLRFYAGFHYLDVMLSGHSVRLYYVLTTGIAVLSPVGLVGIVWFSKYLKAMLFVFGLSFALFGFQPYTPYSQLFEVLVTYGALALLIVNLKDKCFHVGNRRLLLLLLLYACLSGLSLLQLPLVRTFKGFALWGASWSFWVFGAAPAWDVYAIAGVNKLALFVIFIILLSGLEGNRGLYRTIFLGALWGAVISTIVGLLDYYGVISLTWFRRLDPVINPDGLMFRLQSTFGNPGWFAEFVTVTSPFVLVGFLRKDVGNFLKVFLFGILILFEIALILAKSRSGWVCYPLTLITCWTFFYLYRDSEKGTTRAISRKNLIKVVVSIPVTLLISLIIVLKLLGPPSASIQNAIEKLNVDTSLKAKVEQQSVRSRAAMMLDTRGRTTVWIQGIDVGRERPLFGMGYESYRWQKEVLEKVEESYIRRNGSHRGKYDTPHNLYVQLFVSGGLVGLVLWCSIVGYAFVLLVADLLKNRTYFNVCVLLSIVSFHIYGIFQSMQYVPMIWFLIFLLFGYALTIDDGLVPRRIRRFASIFVKLSIVLVLIGGVVYLSNFESKDLAEKYGLEVYAQDQDSNRYFGFYEREKWPEGYYRWSGPRARCSVRGQGSVVSGQKEKDDRGQRTGVKGLVGFDFVCGTPGVEKEPVRVIVSLDGKPIDEIVFDRNGGEQRWYYVKGKGQGAGGRGQEAKSEENQKHEFLFDVSRTWNPKKMGISGDVRDLGVAVSEPKFLEKMPKDGIGFSHWEKIEGGGLKTDDGGGKAARFRWTGRRASEKTEDGGQRTDDGGLVVFLRCAHPGIDKEPVVVKVLGDGEVLRYLEFRDYGWKKVAFGVDELKGKTVITYEVSRTWNPKRMGISGDDRDLGVAVATNEN
jgi:O-antigen ligase